MDKQQILSQISEILKIAHLQIDVLNKNPEKFSALEADLVKDYLRIAYDKLNVLTFLSADENQAETSSPLETSVENKAIISEEPATTTPDTTAAESEDEQNYPTDETEEATDPQEETVKEEEPQDYVWNRSAAKPEAPSPSKEPEKTSFSVQDSPIIAETFQEEHNSVVDKLARETEDHSLLSKIANTPLVELKKAIGVNDRFTFINELFEGNISNYTQFIDEVDQFEDGLEAWEFVEKIKGKKNWDSASSAYKRLFELLQRKFSVL